MPRSERAAVHFVFCIHDNDNHNDDDDEDDNDNEGQSEIEVGADEATVRTWSSLSLVQSVMN